MTTEEELKIRNESCNTHEWLTDGDKGVLKLQEGDCAISDSWITNKIDLKTSLWHRIKNALLMFLYFGIYALISYFLYDRGKTPMNYDETLQALFLPVLGYLLIAYRSFDKFIFASAGSVALLILYNYMIPRGIITFEGVTFIRYLLWALENFGFGKSFFLSSTPQEIGEFIVKSTFLLIFIEFLLMILYNMVKKPGKIKFALSEQALYIQAKSKRSIFTILKLIAYIAVSPFNISNYHEIAQQWRYYKLSGEEAKKYDYAMIPIPAIKKIKKKKESLKVSIIAILITIGLGFLFPLTFLFTLIFAIRIFLGKRLYNVEFKIKRKEIEGSWIMSNTATSFKLIKLKDEHASWFKSM